MGSKLISDKGLAYAITQMYRKLYLKFDILLFSGLWIVECGKIFAFIWEEKERPEAEEAAAAFMIRDFQKYWRRQNLFIQL